MVISVNALGETEILMGYSLFSCRKSSQKAGTTDFFNQRRDTGDLRSLFSTGLYCSSNDWQFPESVVL